MKNYLQFHVKKRTLLAIAGIVWIIAGVNVSRVGIITYLLMGKRIVDAYCGKTLSKNYVNFEFKGGAADATRRNRRVVAISRILEKQDFAVEVTGDRAVARFQKYECEDILVRLNMLGRLLIFTRQMDMLMNSDRDIDNAVSSFLRGDHELNGKEGEKK